MEPEPISQDRPIGRPKANAAYILWLIRERIVKDFEELKEHFGFKGTTSGSLFLYQEIYEIVQRLREAGLIKVEGNKKALTPTRLIEKIQIAFNISLFTLSQSDSNLFPVRPIFGKPDHSVAAPSVFVVMPFRKDLEPVYEDHIRKVCDGLSLSVGRADDFFTTESIIYDIWNAIYRSRLIISDCTGRNANVFYEIGIAHTIGKPVVLIAQDIKDIPFDLRHIRFIKYQYTPRGMLDFEKDLTNTLETSILFADPNGT